MAFKDEIEEICARAIRDNVDVIVRLPVPPLKYTQYMIDERFFQLEHLIKLNGCKITRINITDFKIHKAPEEVTGKH